MAKLALGFVGYPASGKGTIIEYLKKKYEAVSFSVSDEIRAQLKEVGFDSSSRETLQATGNLLRKIYGDHVLAQRVAKKVKRAKDSFVAIDSIRNPGEVNFFKKNLKNFKLISVSTDPKLRFERLQKRGRVENQKTWKEFLISEENEDKKLGVGSTIKLADYCIENDGSFNVLYNKADKLMKELQK